jgi:hypothetical protein
VTHPVPKWLRRSVLFSHEASTSSSANRFRLVALLLYPSTGAVAQEDRAFLPSEEAVVRPLIDLLADRHRGEATPTTTR